MSKITLVLLITGCLVLVYGNIVRRLRNADRFKEFSKELELKISDQDDIQEIADEARIRYRSKKQSSNIITALACRQRPSDNIQAVIHSAEKRVPGEVVSAPSMEFPWHVAIMVQVGQKYEFHCGGVLLSPRHLLTAAHCVRECKFRGEILQPNYCTPFNELMIFSEWKCASPQKYKVIYGNDLNTKLSSRFRYVTEYLVMPSFTKNGSLFVNDLASMYWSTKFDTTSWCELEKVQGLTNYDQNCFGIGHGFSRQGQPNSSPLPLRKIRVMENRSCHLNSRHLCFTSAANNRVPSCRGDSGSPVVCKVTSNSPYLVAGLFSANQINSKTENGVSSCSFANTYSVLTRLGATYGNHPSTDSTQTQSASGLGFIQFLDDDFRTNITDKKSRINDFRCNP